MDILESGTQFVTTATRLIDHACGEGFGFFQWRFPSALDSIRPARESVEGVLARLTDEDILSSLMIAFQELLGNAAKMGESGQWFDVFLGYDARAELRLAVADQNSWQGHAIPDLAAIATMSDGSVPWMFEETFLNTDDGPLTVFLPTEHGNGFPMLPFVLETINARLEGQLAERDNHVEIVVPLGDPIDTCPRGCVLRAIQASVAA